MNNDFAFIDSNSARQQPGWGDGPKIRQIRQELNNRPPLIHAKDVYALRSLLARVAAGDAVVVQAGDCAEDPAECTADFIARKTGLLDVLAGWLKMSAGKPVIRVGRIAGQYAKPRSRPTERFDGQEIPAYRGHMVNCPEPDPERRQPDPTRLLAGYQAAEQTLDHLGWRRTDDDPRIETPVWTSHEALLLDYELPMLRTDEEGRRWLASTHWPWIGDRTRQRDGAHVALLASIANPVACKVGPSMTPDELVSLCEALDPEREPGRLALIARLGSETVAERLPPLVVAVRNAGHPVIWLCDPMHGNTLTSADGLKTRFVDAVIQEVIDFQHVVAAAGGLHLETSPEDLTECVPNESFIDQVGDKYTSHCDPRLNPRQAISVVSAWRG